MRSHKLFIRAATVAAASLLIASVAKAQDNDHGHKDKDKVVVVQRANGEVVAVPKRDVVVQRIPPGQYKKLYTTSQGADVLSGIFRSNGYTVTRVVNSGNSRYVYYRLRNGQEQRAIIRPGTDRLSFTNVPSRLLPLVTARLR